MNSTNPSNPSNSTNPMLNALTIDLEDYFQVHAFSNVVRFEDWGNYKSRIEKNTHRLLEILHECKPNFLSNVPNCLSRSSVNSINSTDPINSTNSSNPPSVLSPEGSEFLPPTSNLCPQTSRNATFFILGWLAERYPNLIRAIKDQGHEIACHGYAHKLIYTQTKEEFRNDIRKAKAILEDIIGEEVVGYRAPSYSITNKSQWAFEVLMEEGFKYDSSIFPIHHDFYGFPHAPRFPFLISLNGNSTFEFSPLNFDLKKTPQSAFRNPHSAAQSSVNSTNPINSTNSSNPVTPNSELRTPNCLLEFPLSTVRFCGQNVPISGGGYFRLFPYSVIRSGLTRINKIDGMPFIFYLHPWELDDEQPRINSISMLSRFRHYVNLDKTEKRFKKLLTDFRFSSFKNILKFSNMFVRIEDEC